VFGGFSRALCTSTVIADCARRSTQGEPRRRIAVPVGNSLCWCGALLSMTPHPPNFPVSRPLGNAVNVVCSDGLSSILVLSSYSTSKAQVELPLILVVLNCPEHKVGSTPSHLRYAVVGHCLPGPIYTSRGPPHRCCTAPAPVPDHVHLPTHAARASEKKMPVHNRRYNTQSPEARYGLEANTVACLGVNSRRL
jgi:hypothetical protein